MATTKLRCQTITTAIVMNANFDNIMATLMKDPRITKLMAASSDLSAIKDAILQIVDVAQHLKAILAECDNK